MKRDSVVLSGKMLLGLIPSASRGKEKAVYVNVMKAIHNKPTANILNGKKLESV